MSDVRRYVRQPTEVLAIEWNGHNLQDCKNFLGENFLGTRAEERHIGGKNEIKVKTLEGVTYASIGDYILLGEHNDYYPCKPHIFNSIYEEKE